MISRTSVMLRWGSRDVGGGVLRDPGIAAVALCTGEAEHVLEPESVTAHWVQSTVMADGDDVLGTGHVSVGGRLWSV
jgi:hypothetical protein